MQKKSKKRVREFLPKSFKKGLDKYQKNDKNIKRSDYPYNTTSEELEEKSESELEPKFQETIAQRVGKRRINNLTINNQILQIYLI